MRTIEAVAGNHAAQKAQTDASPVETLCNYEPVRFNG